MLLILVESNNMGTEKLTQLVLQLENQIPHASFSNPAISASTVGWQIEHSLLSVNLITERLKKSNPKEYVWKFNIGRYMILTTQKIPRGRAQAPDVVQPKADFNTDSLKAAIARARESIKELNTLDSNQYFEHPYFGKLNLKPAIQFLQIHTQHHLAIINDIIKTSK